MKLEVGKCYKARNGSKVGPMSYSGGSQWPFHGPNQYGDNHEGMTYREDGTYNVENDIPSDYDLIAEWADAPDLTAITTPFGLLDKATQDALRAHGGPYELYNSSGWGSIEGPFWVVSRTYRVKPQPTVETVAEDANITDVGMIVLRAVDGAQPVRVTFTRTNGVIDLDSYKVESR